MLLPSVVHVSSTFEFGAMFHDCLSANPQGCRPFSPFFFFFMLYIPLFVLNVVLIDVTGTFFRGPSSVLWVFSYTHLQKKIYKNLF